MPNGMPEVDIAANMFQQKFMGSYGEMGHGGNVRVKFIQTALTPSQLSSVEMLRDIEGAEKWSVRDLFQRDVDSERVTKEIMPYLGRDEVKYFNPLTLVMLPLDPHHQVISELRTAEVEQVQEGTTTWNQYEVRSLFRFRVHEHAAAYASVEYDPNRIKLVAIDGQHRLSALKRWQRTPEGAAALTDWLIPVVILGIVKNQDIQEDTTSLLSVVRKMFVYINTKAERIHEARRILLDDESINRLCVQEMVQASHENDVKPIEERDPDILPLLFFDWRGEMSGGVRRPQPSSVLETTELLGWMEAYLLGQDGKTGQKTRLQIADMIPPLESPDLRRLVAETKDPNRIRKQFGKVMYPGIRYLLENIAPYKEYISELRALEQQYLQATDLTRHAWARLRFGFDHAPAHEAQQVNQHFTTLEIALRTEFGAIVPALLQYEIGMRGVVSAFSHLKAHRDEQTNGTTNWLDFAEWFVPGINNLIDQDWFLSWGEQGNVKKQFLTHVAFEPSGAIRNYKLGPVKNALGTLLALLVLKEVADNAEELETGWGDLSANLASPLRSGFKAVFKAEFDLQPLNALERNRLVKEATDEAVEEYLADLKSYLDG